MNAQSKSASQPLDGCRLSRSASRAKASARNSTLQKSLRTLSAFLVAAASLFAAAPLAQAQSVIATVTTQPQAVAVNPVTNKIYVPSPNGSVTVIDGAANTTSVVSDSNSPNGGNAVALNVVTNTIYVANAGSDSVSVYAGAVGSTPASYITTISLPSGTGPNAIAVNPQTNYIYTANYGGNSVNVINGGTNNFNTVALGTGIVSIAVNSASNLVYAGSNGNSIFVLNGAIGANAATLNNTITTNVSDPTALAVNETTGYAYAANYTSDKVVVISGTAYLTAITDADLAGGATGVAVNPLNNTVYVTGANYVSVINGATSTVITDVTIGAGGSGVVVDTASNMVYALANGLEGEAQGTVTVINGNTNSEISNLDCGTFTQTIGVNPVTHRVYAANWTNPTGTVTVIDGSTNALANVYTGDSQPVAIAVNPSNNLVYVVNQTSDTIAIINGTNDTVITNDPIGADATAVAVNPITNIAYIAIADGGENYTWYNGGTFQGNIAANEDAPAAVVVNPVNNEIFGYDKGAPGYTIIDGASETSIGVTASAGGGTFSGMAIDMATNQTYVGESGASNSLLVMDGGDVYGYGQYSVNVPSDTSLGQQINAIAVNPNTNFVYVALSEYDDFVYGGSVAVMSGGTFTAPYQAAYSSTVSDPNTTGSGNPTSIAVNPVSNTVYVANLAFGTVSVFSGATSSPAVAAAYVTTISLTAYPYYPTALAVNPVTNKIYVACTDNNIRVIDGVSNTVIDTISVSFGTSAAFGAIDPTLNHAYFTNPSNGVLEQVTEDQSTSPAPAKAITTTISTFTNNTTTTPTPTFTFSTSNTLTTAAVNAVYYQVDTWQGTWSSATLVNANSFTATTSTLQPGYHIIFAYATDGEEANGSLYGGGPQGQPIVGTIASYGFAVAPPIAFLTPAAGAPSGALAFGPTNYSQTSSSLTATLGNDGGSTLGYTYQVTGPNAGDFNITNASTCTSGTLAPTSFKNLPCNFVITFAPSQNSNANATTAETATLVLTDNSYGVANSTQTISLSGTSVSVPIVLIEGPPTVSYEQSGIISWITAPGVTYLCALDTPSYTGCGTPYNYSNLSYASHQLGIESVDSYGNVSAPYLYDWQIELSQQTVVLAGTGTGTVTSAPTGISCPSTCVANFNGENVILTATANGGSTFAGWSNFGNTCPGLGTCTVDTGDGPQTTTATFNLTNFTNTVNVCPAPYTNPAPCSQTATFTYTVPSTDTYTAVNVLTQGASGLDFTLASTTCTGSLTGGNTCTINVTFTPKYPGLRMGAIQLQHSSSPTPATIFISAVAQGPAVGLTPSLTATVPATGLGIPAGVAVDGAGDIFIANYENAGQVLKIPAGGGPQSTVGTGLNSPWGVAVDGAGNVYIADSVNSRVVEVTPGGVQTTLPATVFYEVGLAIDGAGDLYIADSGNNRVVELPAGGGPQVTISTGSYTLSNPNGIALDAAGDLFIADSGNTRIVEVPAGAGSPSIVNTGSHTLVNPYGVAVDAAGDLFIADNNSGGNGVIEVPATGPVSTVVGGNTPWSLTVDASGNLYISDYGLGTVSDLQRSQPPTLNYASTDVGYTSADSPQSVTVQNAGNQPLTAIAPGLTVGSNFTKVTGPGVIPDCTTTFSLIDGASCNLSISFMPEAGGPLTSSAVLTDNALNASPATQSITLTGTGLPSYTLTVSGAGTGSGEITDLTNAISCTWNGSMTSGNCSAPFSNGTVVYLTATPSGGSSFSAWGGSCFSYYGTNPCSVTMNSAQSASATFNLLPSNYTLSVSGFGTGSGTISDGASINCTWTGVTTSGNCSTSYPSGTPVTLTATGTAGSSFGGWGGGGANACTGSPSTNPCSFTLSSNTSASSSFVPAPQSIILSFPMGTNVKQEAIFDCPSNTNPCTDPNAHALAITVPQVLTPFTLTVTSTEVPSDQADGICETGNTVLNDFDCRFVTFFSYGTVPSGIQVPLCYPYANGDCVHYDLYQTTPGNEPPTGDYLGPVNWFVTFNNDTYTPPSPYTGSLPRLFDDPDYPVFPTSPYGTVCTQPMQSSNGPESYSCQFEFDITSSYVPGQQVDTGIGGTTRQFNDVVVAFPPNTPGEINVTSTPDAGTVTTGNAMGLTITLTNPGAGTDLNVTLQDPLPAGTNVDWSVNTSPNQGTCSISGAVGSQVLSCSFGNIASLATVSFHITSGSSSPGNYVNSATVNNSIQQILSISSIVVPSQLTVVQNGTGGGSVSSSPAGITCPGTCVASFNNIPVTLTATPIANSTFAGWSGGGCSGVGTCVVNTALGYQSVTATFNFIQYTLSVSGLGTGTGEISDSTSAIACYYSGGNSTGSCSAPFNIGTVVYLTAQGTGYSSFTTWGGGACSGVNIPCTVTMNSNEAATATFSLGSYNLSVTGLGTGTGTIKDGASINCTVSGNTTSGTCTASYSAGTPVTLTATHTGSSSFGGWGGGAGDACTSTPAMAASDPCTFTLNANTNAAASFYLAPQSVTLSFPTGTNVRQEAIFDCPSNTNPCTDPDAHALALTVPQVLVPFTLTVTATEVSPSMEDGVCETGDNISDDFDCRFVTFFSYGTVASPAGVLVPLCYPYANGDCIHYNVYQGALGSGNEPPTADYVGPVNWNITWNDDTYVPPAPYTGSQPRLFDDPDYAVFPTSAFGTNCADPMYIGSTPQSYSCQFEYDITTFYTPGTQVDSGIGGTTRQFNDVVVAFPPSTPGELNVTTTPDSATVTAGAAMGFTITVTNTSSTGTDTAVTLQDPLPAGTGLNWSISPAYSGPGTCAISGAVGSQVLSCSFGNIAPLGTFNFHITSGSSSIGDYINSATAVNNTQQILSIAAINVTAIPASFGGISAPSGPDPYGTPSITLSGSLSGGDPTYPAPGEFVTVTIGTSSGKLTFGSTGAFTGTVNISTLAASTTPYTIVYSYAGDSLLSPATNSSTTLTIQKANQSITFTDTPTSEPYGATFTASASSTSNLTVSIGASGSCSISSNTVTMTSGAGACTLTASQSGNGNYNPATNVVKMVSATTATSTTTITSNTPNPSTTTQAVTVGVKVTGTGSVAPTGTVTVTAKLSSTTVTCAATLSGGTGSCQVSLTTAGSWTLTASYGGNSNFATSTTASSTSQTVSAPQSTLKFTPSALNFGTVYVGETVVLSTTITNSGSSMVTFSNFSIASISGDDSSGYLGVAFCPTTLNAGKSCTIIMSFTADSQVTKIHAADLVIKDNAAGSPQDILMSATVINPIASVSPSSLSFGNETTGKTSASKTVTITNTGTTNLILSAITYSGNFASTATGTTCTTGGAGIAPSKSCTIAVVFTPSSKGAKTGTLTITDNAQKGTSTVSLSGTGD